MKTWKVGASYDEHTNIIETLLELRGVGKADQEAFLHPPALSWYIKNLPVVVKDALKDAKKIVLTAIAENTPIVVYGDYDADGICATAILYSALTKELEHANTQAFIPNRFEHGYGLSKNALAVVLEQLPKNQKALFITVDTGITAVNEIKYLTELGHAVIVTDHHQKAHAVPPADVILWHDQVVGSTLSWLLALTLGSTNKQSLGLVALATVTDLQPLTNFNRKLVIDGLELLNTSPPLGIKFLAKLAKVSDKPLGTYDLGWVLGPRLNAGGRVIDAQDSLRLLISDEPAEMQTIAQTLSDTNLQRQDMTHQMYELAAKIDKDNLPKIIISHDENYHEGIIGLVAAKLTQTYYRPAIVIALNGEVGKGSVRSVVGIDIISILRQFDDLFLELGGHPMAAGFAIEKKNIAKLEEKLIQYFAKNVPDELFVPTLQIDLELPLTVVELELVAELNKLQPFGIGNSEPTFLTKEVTVVGLNKVGNEGQHLSLQVSTGKKTCKAIMFNAQEHEVAQKVELGDKLDIVYRLKTNSFNGRVYVDLILVDLKTN